MGNGALRFPYFGLSYAKMCAELVVIAIFLLLLLLVALVLVVAVLVVLVAVLILVLIVVLVAVLILVLIVVLVLILVVVLIVVHKKFTPLSQLYYLQKAGQYSIFYMPNNALAFLWVTSKT